MYAVPDPDPDVSYRRRAPDLVALADTVRVNVQSSSALSPA